MKVIVAAGLRPFDHDDMEMLSLRLIQALRHLGHEAEPVRLDACFPPHARVADQAAALRSLRFDRADRLITLGWPATLLRHDRKTIWLNQRSVAGGWLADCEPEDMEALRQQERLALRTAHRVLAMSGTAEAAAKACHDLDATLLPLPQLSGGERGEAARHVISMQYQRDSRAHLDLAFAAIASTDPQLSLLLIGTETDAGLRAACLARAQAAGAEGRIAFADRMPATGISAVLDLADPGLSCGFWLQDAIASGLPALVADGTDAWDVARQHPDSRRVARSVDAVAEAMSAISRSTPKPPEPAPPIEAGWEEAARLLLD